jgi:3-oxoacyl-[acyl-carrier protein] reductase
MGRFEGKVVMIVGAGRGIGAATAAKFAAEGASLALFDVAPSVSDVLEEVAGGDGLAGHLDITQLESCAAGAQAVIDRFGRVDVLAVIAGVIHEANPVSALPVEDWDRIMDVNLKGPFLLTKAVAPLMGPGGSIVTIGSWYGHSGHAFFGAYCASKGGLIVLTQVLAEELAEAGVRVNCVCPGNINTDMHRDALEAEAAERGISFEEMRDIEWAKIPLQKAGDPSDIADAVAFLSSSDAKYITGASIDVNGGVMFR